MTLITGAQIPTADQIIWYIGGVHIPSGDEEDTEVAGIITLTNKAEWGSVVVVDEDGVESTQCLEFQADGTTPATQTSGTEKVRTTAAGTDKMYPDYVAIAGVGAVLEEVLACQDVSFKMSADEFAEAVQNQLPKVKKTGAISWDMSMSMMDANLNFVALVYGAKTTDSPEAGDSKQHDLTGSINDIGTLVGSRFVSGVQKRKYFVMGCSVKSLTHDYPASGFSKKSFDFVVSTKREVNLA
jgi:hypothetical protein